MSCKLGSIIAGPALIRFKGRTFYSKGDITLSDALESFAIEVDAYGGQVEEREANAPLSLAFVPAGEFEALDVLWPYGDPVIGGSVVAVTRITAVDAVANTIEVKKHRLRTEAPIRFDTLGTLPAGLVEGTLYYARRIDADTISVHPTAADATANTNAIDITDAGTGRSSVVEQEPLEIHTLEGKQITFHVAAVVQMPDFIGSAVQTAIGSVGFEIFRKNGVPASTADSRYTIGESALADTQFDPAAIITQPYSGSWGAVAPWDDFSTKNGFTASFPMELEPIQDDACGVIGRKIRSVRAEVRAQPTNVDEAAMLTARKLQGAGAGRGRRIAGDDLNITGTGVYVRIYGAALRSAPQIFSSRNERAGELVWGSSRTFTAGVPGPVFYIGTGAPA